MSLVQNMIVFFTSYTVCVFGYYSNFRAATCDRISKELQQEVVHPFDNDNVIAGQV